MAVFKSRRQIDIEYHERMIARHTQDLAALRNEPDDDKDYRVSVTHVLVFDVRAKTPGDAEDFVAEFGSELPHDTHTMEYTVEPV